jgi:hypothetical protein
MERLGFLAGPWSVTPEFGSPDGGWSATEAAETEFSAILGGTFWWSETPITWPDGQVWSTVSIWSYDRFRNEYRVTFLDDLWGLLDVYEGRFEDGELKVSNGRSQTWGPSTGGPPAMARVVLHDVSERSFVLEWEGSTDGVAWSPAGLRWRYRKIE